MTPARRKILLSSTPRWVLRRAGVDGDFTKGRFWNGRSVLPLTSALTVSRASVGYIDDLSGNWTSVAANLPRWSNKSLSAEEFRTNSIRNNSMQGTVPGSPGTQPNFASMTATTDGLTRTINQIGTQNGIDFIEVRWAGTTSIARTNRAFYTDEAATQVAAVSGQVWTNSRFLSVVAGSQTNLTMAHGPTEQDSGGVFLAGNFTAVTPDANFTRYSSTRTLNNASTAFANGGLFFTYSSGVVIDITIRIGGPQLELGAFVTSPIRSTTAAAARAADQISRVRTNQNPSTLAKVVWARTAAASGFTQTVWEADDGTGNNRLNIRRETTGHIIIRSIVGGATQCALDLGTVADNTDFKVAARFNANDFSASLNGAAVVTDTLGTMPLDLTTDLYGREVNGLYWNSRIYRDAEFVTLPDAALQALTA